MVQREVADRFFAAAGDEGVRGGLRARPAPRASHRVPSRVADRVPAAAQRRLGARRVRAHPGASRCRTRAARRERQRSPIAGRRWRTRWRSPASRGARRRSQALAEIGRAPERPRGSPRARGVRAARGCAPGMSEWRTARRAREAQPGARRRAAASRRQARGGDYPRAPVACGHGVGPTRRGDRGGRVRRRHARPRRARRGLARLAEGEPRFEARIEKRIPVAAGLGGGSSDAATALVLANGLLDAPLDRRASSIGSPRRSAPTCRSSSARVRSSRRGTGRRLGRIELPARLRRAARPARRGRRSGRPAMSTRRSTPARASMASRSAAPTLLAAIDDLEDAARVSVRFRRTTSPPRRSRDELVALGAFRADVTGAGPVVYGLFDTEPEAAAAAARARRPRAHLDRASRLIPSSRGQPGPHRARREPPRAASSATTASRSRSRSRRSRESSCSSARSRGGSSSSSRSAPSPRTPGGGGSTRAPTSGSSPGRRRCRSSWSCSCPSSPGRSSCWPRSPSSCVAAVALAALVLDRR